MIDALRLATKNANPEFSPVQIGKLVATLQG